MDKYAPRTGWVALPEVAGNVNHELSSKDSPSTQAIYATTMYTLMMDTLKE